MIELRWLVPPETSTAPPRLQMRVLLMGADASGALNVAGAEWSEWRDVPTVALPTIRTITAPATAAGEQK